MRELKCVLWTGEALGIQQYGWIKERDYDYLGTENVCPWAGKLVANDCHGKVLSLRSIAKLQSKMGNKRRMEIYMKQEAQCFGDTCSCKMRLAGRLHFVFRSRGKKKLRNLVNFFRDSMHCFLRFYIFSWLCCSFFKKDPYSAWKVRERLRQRKVWTRGFYPLILHTSRDCTGEVFFLSNLS